MNKLWIQFVKAQKTLTAILYRSGCFASAAEAAAQKKKIVISTLLFPTTKNF